MIHALRLPLSVAALALLLLGACQRNSDSVRVGGTQLPAPPAEGTAVVFGTVFDLKTGDPASGVEVEAPGGKSTRTDAQGRFQLAGLAVGTQGEVIARAEGGREARLLLPALGNERREIVLHLAAK